MFFGSPGVSPRQKSHKKIYVSSVFICVQVVKTRINKGFLDAMDGHCQ